MEQQRVVVDISFIEWANVRIKDRLKNVQQLWTNYTTDPKKKERLADYECLTCFYGTHIAGQAMTQRPCADCDTFVHSGSTRCGVLCLKCAKKRKLCTMCGGNINLKVKE